MTLKVNIKRDISKWQIMSNKTKKFKQDATSWHVVMLIFVCRACQRDNIYVGTWKCLYWIDEKYEYNNQDVKKLDFCWSLKTDRSPEVEQKSVPGAGTSPEKATRAERHSFSLERAFYLLIKDESDLDRDAICG